MTECKETHVLSVLRSIEQCDYTKEMFLKLAFKVSYWSKGGINYQALEGMTMNDLYVVANEAEKLQAASLSETGKIQAEADRLGL